MRLPPPWPPVRNRSEEDFRRAASVLANAVRQNQWHSLLVASAYRGEGTTTVALHMAVQLQQRYAVRPLVIELNRRRPAFSKLFALDAERGFSAIAAGRLTPAECIQSGPGGVALIPAGTPPAPGEPLPDLRTVLCRVVRETEAAYDVVMLDAPPVLEEPDVMILGAVVPRLVLVVRAGHTPYEVVERVKRHLEVGIEGFTIVGAVLNRHRRYIPGWIYRWLAR